MRLFLLVLIFLALLVNCSPEDSSVKSAIEQDFDRSRTIIHTTVIWHDTQGQVDKVFSESFGDKEPGRTAFAIWPETSDDPWCTIHALQAAATINMETISGLESQFEKQSQQITTLTQQNNRISAERDAYLGSSENTISQHYRWLDPA